MNKSEEKLRKPHFLAFLWELAGLEVIKNWSKSFPLILPKKHSLITQNRFWLIFVKKIDLPTPPPPRTRGVAVGKKMTQKPNFGSNIFGSSNINS